MGDEQKPVNWKISVDDDVSQPLAFIEKSFNKFFDEMKKNQGKYTDEVEKFNDETEKAIKNGDTRLDNEKKTLGIKDKLIAKIRQEKEELAGLGLGWKGITGLIGGATLIGSIITMVKSFIEMEQAVADLNSAFSQNSRALSVAQDELLGYGRTLGYTREELLGLTRQGLELGKLANVTKQSVADFRTWTKETLILSKATGMATSQVGDMYNQVTDLYGLGHQNLRSLGSAFKYVADMSSISSDELAAFVKNLTPIFDRLPNLSQDARKNLTVDMMGMAGVMSDAFGDPNKMSDMFGEMLDRFSTKGQTMLAELSGLTGKSVQMIESNLREGNFVDVIADMASAFNKMPNERLEEFAHLQQETLGLEFRMIKALQAQGKEGGKVFRDAVDKARKAAKQKDIAQKAAQQTQSLVTSAMNKIKTAIERVWITLGKGFTEYGKGPIDWVAEKMVSLAEWFRKEGQPGGAIPKFFSSVKKFVVDAWSAIGPFLDRWGSEFIEQVKYLASPEGGQRLKEWFYEIVDSIGLMAKGIKGIAEFISGIKEVLKTDEQRVRELVKTQTAAFGSERLPRLQAMMDREMKEGGRFKFGKIEMEALPSNVEPFMKAVTARQSQVFMKDLLNSGMDRDTISKNLVSATRAYQSGIEAMTANQYASSSLGFGQRATAVTGGGEAPVGTGLFAMKTPDTAVKPIRSRTSPPIVNVTTPQQSNRDVVEAVNKNTKVQEEVRDEIRRKGAQMHPTRAGQLNRLGIE